MKCNSAYPTTIEEMNLVMIKEFQEKFNLTVGLSDHSGTIYPSLAALWININFLELHIPLTKTCMDQMYLHQDGQDH